ncbi:Rad53p [Rhizophagus irregularis DAOM 197198w]|uniref:Rad53p n=1 Tax=Rhizophagus irregularis (strain DAOM 197198w) TaxID=1432141 RepID=A0A015ICU7_RHIIW|nr:Rad53p [Rhizophagus irregularis DAOM 197198w]
MAENSKINNLKYYIHWLDNSISEEHIKYYKYSDFTNIQQIGKGAYGIVVRASWKILVHHTLKEVVKELKLHRSVDDHENIIRLYGITKIDTTHQINEYYSLVLEYANDGTLNTYLNNHFDGLGWNDKYRLALQLASAVEFLHKKEIIHRDLHANNILVHQNNIKLADFGLSKKIAEASSSASRILGVIPYVDPKKFNDQNKNYKLNEKSDVYSIGVLLWQISSGCEPFKNKGYDYDASLMLFILKGKREEMIYGTPVEYNKLYTECWKYEPNERPNMQEVVSALKAIISPNQNDTFIDNINKRKEPENYKSVSNLSDRTTDLNNDLINVKSLNIDGYESELKAKSEYNPSSASNKAGSSMDDTYYYRNQSLLKPGKENFTNNANEKENLEKYKSTSKLSKGTIDIVVNNDLISVLGSLNIYDEHKSEIKVEFENSSSSTSNQAIEPSTEDACVYNNQLLFKLENEGFITPDEKVKELVKELTEPKFLYALKLLFENLKNDFSSQVLVGSLKSLTNPTLFDYYSEENVVRLELHLRVWIAVLERIQFSNSPIVLSKDLLDKVCNSLAKFVEIYYKTIQVIDKSNLNQQRNKMYNYNIDFLLIYLQDMLYSLRDDITWFKELIRRIKDLLKPILNITPSSQASISDENYSIESMIVQLRQDLSFKYSVPSYYIDWRIMLIIQHNLFIWSEDSEKIISKKYAEMILIEYIWSFLEKEWTNVADKSVLDFQAIFDIVSDKFAKTLKNTGNFLNDFTRNEPLVLPHTLWFGLLDLAQNLIQKTTQTSTYGLCYYLAIESLNKAPSNFIQFKVIEMLLHLYNVDEQMFSIIEDDFDQYIRKLNENKSADFSEKFQNLLTFVKEKYFEDSKILNDSIGKGEEKGRSLNQNKCNIIDVIADEMTCPISNEPTDQLCILKCQHILSLNKLKNLKQNKCPICREKLEKNNIRYLPQNTVYKNLYLQFFEAGHILPTIELENSEQITNDQYDSDSDNSEVDLILTKKKKFMKAIKLNSNILSSIFSKVSRKQHPIYKSIIKELNGKYYRKAESLCKEYLELFPKSYSVRCILAYIYRCLNNYEQAHLYLEEAIKLKQKQPIAYFIYGDIFFWEGEYDKAINNLNISLEYKVKSIINLPHIILGNSFLKKSHYDNALKNYIIALKNDPNNNLCLKNCAYIFEKQEDYINCSKILDRLLNTNDKDSLILCYYGEILKNLRRYDEAVTYFTKANSIDPENIHNLNKRAIAYFVLQEYEKTLLDLDKVIQLDPSNNLAHYNRGLTYYSIGNIENAITSFEKCVELDPDDNLSKIQLHYMEYLQKRNRSKDLKHDIITKIDQILEDDKSLSLIVFKIYIDLSIMDPKEYFTKFLSFLYDKLYNNEDISFLYLLQSMKYSNFWADYLSHLKWYDSDLTKLGIFDPFSSFLYGMMRIYFITNFINLNNEFQQYQVNDTNSLSGQVLSFDGKTFTSFSLPELHAYRRCVIWKINVKKILSKDCFIKLIIKYEIDSTFMQDEHVLKFEDVLKLEGLGWIEHYSFKIPKTTYKIQRIQPSIEVNGLNMQVDYIRFTSDESRKDKQIYFPKIGHLLPIHKVCPNVPEAFKDKYFSRKEMENLLELKDIIDNL